MFRSRTDAAQDILRRLSVAPEPILFHGREAEPVDVVVYRKKGFEAGWFLIVPPDSEAGLPTAEAVRLYRERMQIEQCFRDGKSPLGLRGLHLQVAKSERLWRLLRAFTSAYLLVLLPRPSRHAQGAQRFVSRALSSRRRTLCHTRAPPLYKDSHPPRRRSRRHFTDRLLTLKLGEGKSPVLFDTSELRC